MSEENTCNAKTAKTGETASVGASITIKGEVTGSEDLIIRGVNQ